MLSSGGGCLLDTFVFFYCLTFLWVYQHLSSWGLFIKYHLLWSFASLLLFSPLNYTLREGTFMFFHVQPLGQPFPALWGWHLNLHANLCSASLPASLLSSALARDGSISELAVTGSISHKRSFWQLLPKAASVASPASKPCHKTQYIPFFSFPSV